MAIIAIIGIDGSGKTTQAKILIERLKKFGHMCIYIQTEFVILNILMKKLRIKNFISPRAISTNNKKEKILLKGLIKKSIMVLLCYPYALISYVFIKFLSINKIVVCDRWFYQLFFDSYRNSSENIINIFPKPDVTFFLDGNLDLFYSRMDDLDRFVSIDYYVNVLNLHKKLSEKYGFYRMNAGLDKIKINDLIVEHLTKMEII